MRVLAICRPAPGATPEQIAQHVREEGQRLEQLRAAGTLLDAYSPGSPGAVLVLEAADLEEARSFVGDLPLAAAGLIDAELIGLYALPY